MADDVGQFYVTLPSNSSGSYFPENTMSDFTTKLFKPIDLAGQWEVALSEMSFPYSFYNIVAPMNQILYSGDGTRRNVKILTIPEGYYNDADELFQTIHEEFDSDGKANIKLSLNRNTQKVKVRLLFDAFIELNEGLMNLLGFVNRDNRFYETTESDLPIELTGGLYSLFLYTDIVEDQIIGDVNAPLLRIVPIDQKKCGDTVTKTYQDPHFIKLKMSHFDTISMHIRRDTGEKISFQRGKVIVKLCFRSVKSGYFK